MTTRRRLLLAASLLAAVLLAAWATPSDGWLWTALAASGFLAAYARQRVHGLLVLGCLLAGLAGGLLIGGPATPGGFWVALGLGVMAIDRVAPEADKRSLRIGAALTAFGILYGVASAGWLDDLRFAIVIVLAAFLLLGSGRARRRTE